MKKEPVIELRNLGRIVAQEGIVLLENNNNILPIVNKKVAIFGRIQTDYYKSGTGSGGLVNVTSVPSFVDAFLENPRVDVNENILTVYKDWVKENPFNAGNGMWASEPWSQKEMDFPIEKIKSLKRDQEIPIMIIGRTAGEDRDNYYGEGSYLLTKTEKQLIQNIKDVYGKVVVILNVGNIIDMNFVKEMDVDAVLYAWHGGQDGARATVDVITGYINPSGKLPNTVMSNLELYPASETFGNKKEVIYAEDIYVGYRFFETFYPNKVLYPFGYGLSYTQFVIEVEKIVEKNNKIKIDIAVTNIGNVSGKETVQVYYEAPQGKLGKPLRELIAFAKTSLIQPNKKTNLSITIDINQMASYDDYGYISKSSYVLEAGDYNIFVGNSVKNNSLVYTKKVKEEIVVEKLAEALTPLKPFKRIKPVLKNGEMIIEYEDVPTRTIDLEKRIKQNLPREILQHNTNATLKSVYDGKNSIAEFVSNLSVEELAMLVIGEGMSSPKVTSGTASAFGGVIDSLKEKGVPLLCCADGPSGIRMDSGGIATSLPNGTLIAATFNPGLIKELYRFEGQEMHNYEIDVILGPGMNIQRHPLNGRNFEYFSEDPLLTGIMASAVVQGLNSVGVDGSLKHYAANNQETARSFADSIVSERALREIYLKGFEIAVKTSDARTIMTSYNPINGIWAASNYDLNTTILRKEWGFKGIVMTDWWAQMNFDGDKPSKENLAAMIKSQNDLYMVTPDAQKHAHNLLTEYQKGTVTLGEIQRSAVNILRYIIEMPAFLRMSDTRVQELNRKTSDWFKVVTNQSNQLEFLHNKDLKDYVVMYSNDINFSDKEEILLESKEEISYGVLENSNQILYTFGVKDKKTEDDLSEILNNISAENAIDILGKNWDETKLPLDQMVYATNDTSSWNEIGKDQIFTYYVNVNEFGKYIVDLEISSKMPNENQMPFSVYVNDVNKQTLTTNGTEGKKVNIRSFIIMNEGKQYLTFKFHRTGITVHNINVIKHG